MRTEREKQVARTLAAERAARRRDTDAEIAAVRRWVKRGIPLAAAANVALIGLEIWQGVYGAIAANLTVLPTLALSYWLVTIAEVRDHRRDTQLEMYETAADAIVATTVTPKPPSVGVGAAWDCEKQGHIFQIGNGACTICGVSAAPPPEVQAEWFRGLPDPGDPFSDDDLDHPF